MVHQSLQVHFSECNTSIVPVLPLQISAPQPWYSSPALTIGANSLFLIATHSLQMVYVDSAHLSPCNREQQHYAQYDLS